MTDTALPNAFDAAASRQRCMRYRRRILDISQNVTALHIAPAFSCMEMVDSIYNDLMRRRADSTSDDLFLMSKGHGCMIQYVILEEHGVLKTEDLDKYCTSEGRLGAHPDYGVPGIEAATGSLGHGMAMATGMAYAEKLKNNGARVFTVLSDGEMQEGSTWEAILMAANMGVDNLIACLDLNDFQSLGRTSETHPHFYPVIDKMRAFGWEVAEVNGHNAEEIYQAATERKGGAPMMIIGNTTKGRGVSYMESVPIWHYRAPNPEEYKQAIDELQEISS